MVRFIRWLFSSNPIITTMIVMTMYLPVLQLNT